ncbi:MAG: hypothetical protein RSA24_00165 [Clostridia bacterium]
MSEIKVKIVLIPPTQGNIASRVVPQGNNISDSTALQGFYGGAKPFVLGASKLGGGDTYWSKTSKYGGWIDSKLTSINGEANATITINGTDIDNFVLRFDQVAGQWATELKVDNVLYVNDDPQFVWLGAKANSHTIQIMKWNLPLYPVRITSVTVGLTMEFDRSNLKKIVRGSQIVAENDKPTYGVISQYGSVEIYDNDGEMLDLDELGTLKSNQNIEVTLNDKIIGQFSSDKWSVDNGIAKVELTDKLINWQDKLINRYAVKENETAETIFNYLNGLSGNEVNISVADKNYLATIKIKYSYLESSTLAVAWNKLCEISQMNIYQKENGEIWAIRI